MFNVKGSFGLNLPLNQAAVYLHHDVDETVSAFISIFAPRWNMYITEV